MAAAPTVAVSALDSARTHASTTMTRVRVRPPSTGTRRRWAERAPRPKARATPPISRRPPSLVATATILVHRPGRVGRDASAGTRRPGRVRRESSAQAALEVLYGLPELSRQVVLKRAEVLADTRPLGPPLVAVDP